MAVQRLQAPEELLPSRERERGGLASPPAAPKGCAEVRAGVGLVECLVLGAFGGLARSVYIDLAYQGAPGSKMAGRYPSPITTQASQRAAALDCLFPAPH